jgi:Transcriptional regulatory protein, C terminal
MAMEVQSPSSSQGARARVAVATVTLIGDDPSQARAFLLLGAVVILAADAGTLDRWWTEFGTAPTPARHPAREPRRGLEVDHFAHCIRWEGEPLPLTELEFRVLASLAADPGQARSYRELRRAGWGNVPDLGDDAFVVRAVIQRMRRKLARAGVMARIVPVRGFGLRLESDPEST